MKWLQLWFGLSASVSRKTYLLSGLGLMVLRCLGDGLVLLVLGGKAALTAWSPLLYLAPTLLARSELLKEMLASPQGDYSSALASMAIWALPFAWIGVSMSFRRALNAGLSPWLGLVFLVPVFNLLLIAALCVVPSRTPSSDDAAAEPPPAQSHGVIRAAMEAIAGSALFGVAVTAASVFVLGDYGSALFVAGPFVMGAIGGWRINRDSYRGYKAALVVGLVSNLLCFGLLMLSALEGIVCLLMVAPLALTLTLLGSLAGAALARSRSDSGKPVAAMALMLPVMGMGNAMAPPPLPVHTMVSEITIDAPPEAVWPNVIGFSELPAPEDWVLKTGISTPIRARIEGEGVGAVRYCEFTTGDFVEPITVWQPPQRLGFDVTEQPEPMAEWSPYEVVYAPHLRDTMLSRRGEFLLTPTADGGTLLQGTTWYTLDLAPNPYWRLWSDFVVHRIHMRVLRHVKALSEAA